MQKMKNAYWRSRIIARMWWGRQWWWRSKLRSKAEREKAREYISTRASGIFFILGSGRSGTQLLTDLLGKDERAMVFHEPNFCEDVATMDEFRRDPDRCVKYWQEFRLVEIARRWSADPKAMLYGEVNGTIRYHAPAIRQVIPDASMFLIVRDGRGVVRSVMGWPQFYGPKSKGAYALSPLPGDPFYDEWEKMSRFEKICWGWQECNEFLMKHISEDNWLQLERLVKDYEYFKERLLDKIGIDIPYSVWLSAVSRNSRNASKAYGFPAWEEWSTKEKKAFIRICGDTMRRLGYEI